MEKEEERAKEDEAEESVKQSFLTKAEISLLLDTYDDIFSDFDPRPYPQRALSDDFLIEAKKAARDKDSSLELSFMIPKSKRKIEDEILIRRRLREHFKKHVFILESEVKKVRKEGVIMAFFGLVLLALAAYVAHKDAINIFYSFLLVLLEPAGWFTIWTGLEQIYHSYRDNKPDLNFYQKMTRAEISFHPY